MRTDRPSALDIVYDAQQRNIDRMIEAWDKQIDRAIESQIAETRKRSYQQAQAASLQAYLNNLVAQAQAGARVAIPAGISIASSVIQVSIGDELAALHDAVEDLGDALPPAQHSAAWAMSAGYLPHPGDIAQILDDHGLDPQWARDFRGLAKELDQRVDGPQPLTLLGVQASRHLDALEKMQRGLRTYGGARLVDVVLRPNTLASTRIAPPVDKEPKAVIQAALAAFRQGSPSKS